MRTLARITAIVLIVLGALVIVSAVGLAASGVMPSMLALIAAARPLRGGVLGSLLVAYVLIHGVLISSAGEALYLLADHVST